MIRDDVVYARILNRKPRASGDDPTNTIINTIKTL